MIKIYHNPRCSKSRMGVAFLEDAKINYEVVNYLKEPPSEEELKDLIDKLGITPIELVRKNEKIWKENYKGKDLSDDEIIKAMVENPKLIERPIVINGNKAVVARPTEKIKEIL